MFSLIITIIGIVLVAALAVATLYHMGGQLQTGEEAKVAQILNEANQIVSAMDMYKAQEVNPEEFADLEEFKSVMVPDYLSSMPKDWGVRTITSGGTEMTALSMPPEVSEKESLCERINTKQGASWDDFSTVSSEDDPVIPSCSDEGVNQFLAICCKSD